MKNRGQYLMLAGLLGAGCLLPRVELQESLQGEAGSGTAGSRAGAAAKTGGAAGSPSGGTFNGTGGLGSFIGGTSATTEGGDDAGGSAGATVTGGAGALGGGGSGGTGGTGEPVEPSGECGDACSCADLTEQCFLPSDCCAVGLVPEMTFKLGDESFETANAHISAFKLDIYEVTVGRFRAFVDAYQGPPGAGAATHPQIPGSGWKNAWDGDIATNATSLRGKLLCHSMASWTKDPGPNEKRPMNCVSWLEAFAFCSWDGGRLPTSAEWELAAVGGAEQRTYPWGEQAPSLDLASYGCGDPGVSTTCDLDDLPPGASRTLLGAGAWGHMDLAGSVAEWVLDWNEPPSKPCNDCAAVAPKQEPYPRLARGSYWSHQASDLRSVFSFATGEAWERVPEYGVRCARD